MTHDVNSAYMSSPQAAKILRITYVGVAQLARQGKIPAVKIANRWLIPRAFVEEFARTYEGKRGRPRKKIPSREWPEALAAIQPDGLGAVDAAAESEVRDAGPETRRLPGVDVGVEPLEQTPPFAVQPGESLPEDVSEVAAAREISPEVGQNARVDGPEEVLAPGARPSEVLSEDTATEPGAEAAGPESDATLTMRVLAEHQEETAVLAAQPGALLPAEVVAASEPAGPEPEADAALSALARTDHVQSSEASAVRPVEAGPPEAGVVSEREDSKEEGDGTFAVSAEVYHLDKNYDFELYEKGRITERARLIVARLKPKIPSLPQFSFRWDYRYEHLNVDIHGVDPSVTDWWTMGKNGYSGHLPRRLGGRGWGFEAIIWLPVTFVFRGRLTVVLRDSPEAAEGSSSVATTTGGVKRLWSKWSAGPRS